MNAHEKMKICAAALAMMAIAFLFFTSGGSAVAQQDDLKKAFDLMKSEALGVLKLDMAGAEVTKALGRPEKQTKPKIWGSDGYYHETWEYPGRGISLDIVSKTLKEKRTVSGLTINAPCTYATRKGIKIGSTYQEVKKAYASFIDSESSDKERIVAGSVYGGLIFSFKEGKVVRIFIGAAAE
jgi:hypothetical protein